MRNLRGASLVGRDEGGRSYVTWMVGTAKVGWASSGGKFDAAPRRATT